MNRLHLYLDLPEKEGQTKKGEIFIIDKEQKLAKRYDITIKNGN